MTLRLALLTCVIVLVNTTAKAQTSISAADQPLIYSGLFLDGPDDRGTSYAAQTGDRSGADLTGILFLSSCGRFGASQPGRLLSAFATDVWRMSGRVLELTDREASVRVGWRRLRRDGHEESSPEQSRTLTLKRGERHTLESIAVPASGSCQASNISLGLVFQSRRELYGEGVAAAASGRAEATAGARSGGTNASAPSWAPEMVVTDLWLVRSTPGRADETLHSASHLMPVAMPYAFAPLTIQTTSGTVIVKVDGTIEAGRMPDGERRVHFTATRSVTAVTTARPSRDGKSLVEGSTKTTFALPGPEEVLSFEMPPLRTPDGVTLPDRLSIRLRVTPSPMR